MEQWCNLWLSGKIAGDQRYTFSDCLELELGKIQLIDAMGHFMLRGFAGGTLRPRRAFVPL
jgi:hypothetical protein